MRRGGENWRSEATNAHLETLCARPIINNVLLVASLLFRSPVHGITIKDSTSQPSLLPSPAPPTTPTMKSPPHAHVALFLRRNGRLLGLSAFVIFLVLISQSFSDHLDPTMSSLRGESPFANFGGAVRKGYYSVESSVIKANEAYHITAVADLDKRSKVGSDGWYSVLKPGVLKVDKFGGYGIKWGEEIRVTTKHNEKGRGMELSELTVYDGRLLSFGDRTGIVFEFLKDEHVSED